jgi:hypothetical protein
MEHCVASYTSSCVQGKSTIWTMEVESAEGRQKILTVEMQPTTKVICQARGKRNARPGAKHREILRRWAAGAGLRLASHI